MVNKLEHKQTLINFSDRKDTFMSVSLVHHWWYCSWDILSTQAV